MLGHFLILAMVPVFWDLLQIDPLRGKLTQDPRKQATKN